MVGPDKKSGRKSRLSYSFSHLLLLWMVVLILVLAIGITYFDYRQAEETYQKNARAMQEQMEADIAGTITVIDSAYEMYDSSLNNEMENAFSLFQKEYERSGNDPAKMDLDALKEALGNEMDLYIINESIMVEYTTDPSDLGLDFRQWPYSYNYLRELFPRDGFFPDRIVHDVTSGKLVKYAYMPTPDHRYILELGLSGKALEERPHVRYQESLKAIALNNPNVVSYRAYDTLGRVIGDKNSSAQSAPPVVRQVISERKQLEIVDPYNNTLTRYLYVDLTGRSFVSDVSWIIELVYDQSELKDQLAALLLNHALVALLATTFSIVLAIVLSHRLTRPIAQMVHDIDTISRGDLEYPIAPAKTTEFEKITRSVTSLVASLRGMIRQLQQNELELVREGENYRAVVENQTELIARFLPDGTHVFVNQAYCRYFGLPWPDILGHKAWPRVPQEDDDLIRRHFSSLSPENPTAAIEHRIITPDGQEHWVQWNDRAIFDRGGNILEYQSVGRDITEKKRAMEELEKYRQNLETAMDLAHMATWEFDIASGILTLNDRFYALYGTTAEQEGGYQMPAEVYAREFVHPDDAYMVAEEVEKAQKATGPDFFSIRQHRIIRRDGQVRWIIVRIGLIRDESGRPVRTHGVNQDITGMKHVEEDLTRSEQKFRDLAGLLPQVIFETGPNGEILYVNQSAYTIFGYTPGEVGAGVSIYDVIHPGDRERAARTFAVSLQGEKIDGAEYRFVRKDGSSMMGMVYSSPIENDGKIIGIRGILIDITHIKEVERDLRNLNEELERRVRERTRDLESAVRELEAFSYSVSHDLRAPLRAIDGFSSIILTHYDEALHPEIRELLQKIRSNAQKMGDLIDSILNFSRMSRQPLSRQTVFPARIVAEQLAQLREMREGRDVTVRTGDLPPCEGDPVLLAQVFQNLLSNAFKFTRSRQHAEIEVGSGKQDGKTVYYVRDNGIGFDMKYASKLFTVFQRLVDEKEYEGTGIGLAIVQRAIQRHGGKVWATGEVGKGATFFFTLE